MNPNILLAVLEAKDILTAAEAQKLSDYLATAIHSTQYKDAEAAVKKLLVE